MGFLIVNLFIVTLLVKVLQANVSLKNDDLINRLHEATMINSRQAKRSSTTKTCQPNEYECPNHKCVLGTSRCNGFKDCDDGADERNCTTMEIANNRLIVKIYPAEAERKVQKGDDVVFVCRDEGQQRAVVEWTKDGTKQFNHRTSIRNGRLEVFQVALEDSGVYTCQSSLYKGSFGSSSEVLLKVKDNTDTKTCAPNEYQCSDKQCILITWKCDGEFDCDDESDEQNCSTPAYGTDCLESEFTCTSDKLCIPRAFHCDGYSECKDRSDEIGCVVPNITQEPYPNVTLTPGDTLDLYCAADGVPTPSVTWSLNLVQVPKQCSQTSVNGVGKITCPNMQPTDSGIYTCRATNNMGSTFAAHDSIVHVNRPNLCPSGYFYIYKSEGDFSCKRTPENGNPNPTSDVFGKLIKDNIDVMDLGLPNNGIIDPRNDRKNTTRIIPIEDFTPKIPNVPKNDHDGCKMTYTCKNSGKSICHTRRCDGVNDCRLGDDEESCYSNGDIGVPVSQDQTTPTIYTLEWHTNNNCTYLSRGGLNVLLLCSNRRQT